MKRMSAGEMISSVVFGGAGALFLLAATDPGRSVAERVVLAICGLGAGLAAFRFQIAALVKRFREGAWHGICQAEAKPSGERHERARPDHRGD